MTPHSFSDAELCCRFGCQLRKPSYLYCVGTKMLDQWIPNAIKKENMDQSRRIDRAVMAIGPGDSGLSHCPVISAPQTLTSLLSNPQKALGTFQ